MASGPFPERRMTVSRGPNTSPAKVSTALFGVLDEPLEIAEDASRHLRDLYPDLAESVEAGPG